MQIEIKPDDIDRLVKDALMKSAFGDALKAAITNIFASDRWDNPFKIALNEQAKKIVEQIMQEPEFSEPIRAAVKAKLAELVNGGALEEGVKAMVAKMIRNAD